MSNFYTIERDIVTDHIVLISAKQSQVAALFRRLNVDKYKLDRTVPALISRFGQNETYTLEQIADGLVSYNTELVRSREYNISETIRRQRRKQHEQR